MLGGANRTSTVTGPLGDTVSAAWRLSKGTAVIEMARASGLTLAGGFTCGLASLYVVRGAPNFGLIVLLVLGTVVGTMVGALGRERA